MAFMNLRKNYSMTWYKLKASIDFSCFSKGEIYIARGVREASKFVSIYPVKPTNKSEIEDLEQHIISWRGMLTHFDLLETKES